MNLNKLKLLATSDIHIDNWYQYSTIGEDTYTSRLKDFLKLAQVMKQEVIANQVDAIVLAGDTANSPTNQPSVNTIIRKFLEILNEAQVPVLIINGQHDSNSKVDDIIYDNSILLPLVSNLKNIKLIKTSEIVDINNFKILLKSWTMESTIPEGDADIFVGHGIVSGSASADNYVFKTGFNKDELFERFKLSIIGDIHRFHNFDNKILVPGTPVQNTFKDFNENYIHIVKVDENGKVDIESKDVYKLIPNTFHKFLYVDDIKEVKDDNLMHYRLKHKVSNKMDEENKIEVQRVNMSQYIEDFILNDMKSLNLNDRQIEVRDNLLKYFLSNLSNKRNDISKIQIKKVKVCNFLSIKELEVNFDDFEDKIITICGKNGCFTGDTKVKLTNGSSKTFLELLDDYNKGIDNYTYSFSEEGEPEISKIINVQETKKVNKLYKITLDNNEVIKTTDNHLFLNRKGKYVRADELKVGDSLMPIQKNGSVYKVLKIETEEVNEIPVYDLTVDSKYSNFSLDAGVVVHNSGKTSLCESILWGITGCLTKPISVHDIVNSKFPNEEVSVDIELLVNNTSYMISRSRKDKKPYLYLKILSESGEYIDTNHTSVSETQELINKLLNLSVEEIKLFSYFSSDSALSFNNLNKYDRGRIINRLFNITELETLRDLSKEKLKDSENKVLEYNTAIKTISNIVQSTQSRLDSIKNKLAGSLVEINEKLNKITTSISELENEEKELDKTIPELIANNSYDEVYQKLNKTKLELNSVETSQMNLKKQLASASQGLCPVCKKPLTDDSIINNIQNDISINRDKIIELTTVKDELEPKIQEADIYKRKKYELKSKIDSLMSQYKAINESEEKKSESSILELENTINIHNQQLEVNNKLLKDSEEVVVITKYFSNIFKKESKLVEELNNLAITLIQGQINELLINLGSDIKVQVSQDTCRIKFHSEFRDYATLSKGQQRVSDVLFMVALNLIFSRLNVLPNGILGLTVFDEVLSFLDPEYTDLCMDLLNELLSKNVFLITHNKEIINSSPNKISVELVDDCSDYKIIR